MAEKGLPAPTPKPVRAKIPAQTKAKATLKRTTSKINISLEPKVVICPVDHQDDQDTLYPPNQPIQLLDIPAAPQEHIPNPPNPLHPTSTKSSKSTKSTKPTKSSKSTKPTKSSTNGRRYSPTTSIKLVLF